MNKITCISDIHGNFFTFLALLDKIPKDHIIICVGDLIDRGSYSRNVIQFVINQSNPNNENFNKNYQIIKSVKGNHEVMFDHFYTSLLLMKANTNHHSQDLQIFLQNGGDKTIINYSNDINPNFFTLNFNNLNYHILDDHINFIKNLPLFLEIKSIKNNDGRHLLVSHSSAAKVWKWSDIQKTQQIKHFEENILWGRPNNIKDISNIYNIFGHTPKPSAVIKNYYANIDSGAFYDREPDIGYNKLTGLTFPTMEIYEQTTLSKDKNFDQGLLI